ncbi:hypothetical protein Bca52824_001287 [Brassica carinata]|uniref:Uncharacterized protein n=1 Tax=Brassica carinata TaxID=52824 RepID=A0A8X7WIT1_BRACI|nr:hypothetical protein Bca52824_001287 [Brassica carinata]
MCTNVAGVAKYRAKISVYENNDQAIFVLLGDAESELTGNHAAELVDRYFEASSRAPSMATHFPLTSNGGAANSTTGESGPSPDLTPGSTQTSLDATQNTSVRELRL